MRNVLEVLTDSYLGFEKCCSELNLEKWMVSLLGVWCPSLLWLFWHWLDLVLLVSSGEN